MRKKSEMFCQGIVPFRGRKNIQKAVKKTYAERRPKLSPNESLRGRVPVTQTRNADGCSESDAIKERNLIAHERAHHSKSLNEIQIPDEMIERVSEAGRGKYCRNESKPSAFLEMLQEHRVEEKIHQQFLEVKVKAIEKLHDCAGRQRPIGVS
jgi:hypothetical protein